jgi:hypothetical protein
VGYVPRLYDRAQMSSSTTGTGTITLAAHSDASVFSFAEAGVPNGQIIRYVLENGSDCEIGLGTYASAGPTLSRDTVIASRVSGTAGTSKINLSGTSTVYIDSISEDVQRWDDIVNHTLYGGL